MACIVRHDSVFHRGYGLTRVKKLAMTGKVLNYSSSLYTYIGYQLD